MNKIPFDKIPWKKVGSIAMIVFTGVTAAIGAFDENKKTMEFEQMKKDLEDLKKQTD